MTSLRVLMVVEQLRRLVPGGIGRYASGLLGGLAALDEEPKVSLLASRAPSGSSVDPLQRWGLPVHASRLPGPLLTRLWDHGLGSAPPGFDVVHAVSLAMPPVRGSRNRRSFRPAAQVVTVHDLAWRRFPGAATARGRRWHEASLQRALRYADALIAPSEGIADELEGAGRKGQEVHVLSWGADHLPPPDYEAAGALLARLDVRGEYLLSASTREPRKNLHRLVAAYAAARPSLPQPWPLVVVGPKGWGDVDLGIGSDPNSPVPEGVLAAGLVSDEVLAALYERARLFVYVPLTEGYGLPPLEAMTFGVPVVASTGVPSVVPLVGGEPAALRVDPLSTEAITDALIVGGSDEVLRAALSERGRALSAERTWRRCASQHVELWESFR